MIEPPDYDNGPTYSNGESTVWYDSDGDQHVSMNDDEDS